jgi:sec-independent protein translocase protein TatA
MFGLGTWEMMALLVLGVLLFGRKLPDIGRSLGKTIVEFKKGFNGMEEELTTGGSTNRPSIEPEPVRPPQRVTPSGPAFSDVPASNLPPKV